MDKTQTSILQLGALDELERCIRTLASRSLFFVLDEAAYRTCGAMNKMESVLQGFDVVRFSDFEPNPKLSDIERGVSLFRQNDRDVVIALGGGSAIDMGKLIGLLANQPSSARNVITGAALIERPSTPMIAIPTTSGTGSEATHFAVAYVDGNKYSVAHRSSLPDVAIVDPGLTLNLPKMITAATGLDAFCQAIESMWAVGSTEESRKYAIEALQLAWCHLRAAVLSPTVESRLAMSRAAHLAGKAINIGKTTSSHALSYFVTSQHSIPHGIAVALTISQMLDFNSRVKAEDCTDPRGVSFVKERVHEIVGLLDCSSVEHACELIRDFIRELDCPSSYHEAGIRSDREIYEIVTSANLERMSNNPRSCNASALIELLGV